MMRTQLRFQWQTLSGPRCPNPMADTLFQHHFDADTFAGTHKTTQRTVTYGGISRRDETASMGGPHKTVL